METIRGGKRGTEEMESEGQKKEEDFRNRGV
jgi:hypothetical protein